MSDVIFNRDIAYSHAGWHACRVRAVGSTVEAVLSSSKHPDLLQQLLSNVDSLQKAR